MRSRLRIGVGLAAMGFGFIAVYAQPAAPGAAQAPSAAAPQAAPADAWPTAPAHGPKLGGHRFVKRGTGKMYPRDGLMTELKLSAADTAGRFTFIDEVWHPRFTVGPHFHIEHSEIF